MKQQSKVLVYLDRLSQKKLVGTLTLEGRQIRFEYDSHFIGTGLELSPYKLKTQAGQIQCPDRIFDGLFGLFNDSLPDGWGRLLLDRTLLGRGIAPSDLGPLDRLCLVGSGGLGALTYEPATHEHTAIQLPLDEIAHDVAEFYETEESSIADILLGLSGSSQGARPKACVKVQEEDWLVKFKASSDPIDVGAMEFAYHEMAELAGLRLAPAKLFSADRGPGYFGTRRFDRVVGVKQHLHSLCGLLHADHRLPCLDYESVIRTSTWLCQSDEAGQEQIRNMLFNILAHNRDDHSKNFAFLMDADGKWNLAPAFDLTFSGGPQGEHSTTVCRKGKGITRKDVELLAKLTNYPATKLNLAIEQTRNAISQWPQLAARVGVSSALSKTIAKKLAAIDKDFTAS